MATILSIAQERSQIDSFTEIADAVTQLETLNETISLLISNPASGVSDLDAVITALGEIEVHAENVHLNTDAVEAKLDTLDTSVTALTTALAGADDSDAIGDLRIALAGTDTSDKLGDFQKALAGDSSPDDRLGDVITAVETSMGDGTYSFETLQEALAGDSSPDDRIGNVITSVDNLKTALAGADTSDVVGDLRKALAGDSSPDDRIGNVITALAGGSNPSDRIGNVITALAGTSTPSDRIGNVITALAGTGTPSDRLGDIIDKIDVSIGDGTHDFQTLQEALVGTTPSGGRIGALETDITQLKTALAGTTTSDKLGDLQAALAGDDSPDNAIGDVESAIGTSNGHLTNVVSDIDDMNGYMAAQTGFSTGSKSNINSTASQLVSSSSDAKKGVFVMADTGNSGYIYFGGANTVTAGTNGSTDGIPLSGGDNAFIPVDDPSKVFLITGESGNQSAYWMSI